MAENFLVTKIRYAGSKPNPHGGVLHKWEVSLDDEKGQTHHGVYWQSKSDELHIGQEVYGEISDGEYGPRFRTAQREDGAPRASQGVSGGRSGGSAKEDYWDAKDRRIEWAWACNLAAAELGAPMEHDEVVERAREIRKQAREELIDADVGGGVSGATGSPPERAADVSAGNTPAYRMEHGELTPVVRTPEYQEASPQLKGKATQLLNKAGLAPEARKAIILFRCGTLSNPPREAVQRLVRDLEQGATADALLAEVWDAHRAGNNPLATRASQMIPTDMPNAEPEPEVVEPNGEKDIPF